jgi:hypothetical protein
MSAGSPVNPTNDLDGTMRGLAARLGIPIDERRWPELVHAATFDQMRRRAGELDHYGERAAELVQADVFVWLHRP